MAVKTAEQLKAVFAAGKYPTAEDFADLIDSALAGGSFVNLSTNTSSVLYLSSESEATSAAAGSIIIVSNPNDVNNFVNAEIAYNDSIEVTVAPYGSVSFIKTQDGYFSLFGSAIQGGKDGGTQG